MWFWFTSAGPSPRHAALLGKRLHSSAVPLIPGGEGVQLQAPSVPVCPPALLPSLLPLQVFKCPVSKSLLGPGGPNPGLPARETGFGHSPRQGFEAGRAPGAGFAPSLRQIRSQAHVGAPAALPRGHCHGPIEKQRREVIWIPVKLQ